MDDFSLQQILGVANEFKAPWLVYGALFWKYVWQPAMTVLHTNIEKIETKLDKQLNSIETSIGSIATAVHGVRDELVKHKEETKSEIHGIKDEIGTLKLDVAIIKTELSHFDVVAEAEHIKRAESKKRK